MTAYYNEIDPFSAAWLRELIKAGHIAPGIVDERSIVDVRPDDLMEFNQCHFFAGIGVWSYALRCAGWPDDRPVWTASCPCQPFSAAGKGKGFKDDRHLWPTFFNLLSECRPVTAFGEQVASKGGLAWLELVQTDLESAGYACGAVDTCAAGFGAPHIRQRLYWTAINLENTKHSRSGDRAQGRQEQAGSASEAGSIDWLANSNGEQVYKTELKSTKAERERETILLSRCGMDNPSPTTSSTNFFWRDVDWIFCRDGRWRPVVATHVALVDGSATGMVRVCPESAEQEKEEVAHERLHPYPVELENVVPLLSPSLSLAELHGDRRTAEALRALRQAIYENRTLQHPSEPIEAVWASLSEEEKNRIRMGFDALRWRKLVSFPLENGAGNRVGRLRGYGNAIVAPQATEFIRAVMAETKQKVYYD